MRQSRSTTSPSRLMTAVFLVFWAGIGLIVALLVASAITSILPAYPI